jgi:two-component system chemotaxis response regulator CheY
MGINPNMSILVVDDSQTTVRILRTLLSRIGFMHIDDAPDGHSALVKVCERRYGLIIADWNMQPVNGYELLQQVRDDARLARTKVILMTADLKPEHVIAARKAGASGYILKPFTADALKLKIDACFLESALAT